MLRINLEGCARDYRGKKEVVCLYMLGVLLLLDFCYKVDFVYLLLFFFVLSNRMFYFLVIVVVLFCFG